MIYNFVSKIVYFMNVEK